MKLLLLKYNNYYNRILKGYDNIDGYKLAVGTSGYAEIGGVNFNPRDGINTYHTINTPFEFDYMLAFDDTEPYTIRSRWFVIDSQYENLLQRTVTLRRDVLYDYSGSYGTAPAFIEKGSVLPSDSAIYNSENMGFNQVLYKTVFLTDVTQKTWVVGYIAKGRTEDYTIDLSDKTENNNKITIPKSALSCIDAAYDIFVIPATGYQVSANGTVYTNSGTLTAQEIAARISKALSGGGVLYDIQLLPYCPFIRDSRWSLGALRMTSTSVTEGEDYIVSTAVVTTRKAIMLFSKYANFSVDITQDYPYVISSAIDVKVDNETRCMRLISPNSGTIFEFTAAKLGLRGTGINFTIHIKCTYKPYSPYIHIYPQFGGLYGTSRTLENRGLICGGDFSLPLLNDAWSTYEIQNKNYMNAFNRQIENMEVQQNYERYQQITGIASNAIGATVAGAVVGGPAGAIAGAALSAGAGIADYAMSEKLRTEALDYTKDMFGYNLQNIKALPTGLGRVGSTVIDSFVHPIIEFYESTEEEETTLKNKIQWNGMSIGRIGTFNDFKTRASTSCRYIKAQIIRMSDLHEELHTAKAISDELYKGVYIY